MSYVKATNTLYSIDEYVRIHQQIADEAQRQRIAQAICNFYTRRCYIQKHYLYTDDTPQEVRWNIVEIEKNLLFECAVTFAHTLYPEDIKLYLNELVARKYGVIKYGLKQAIFEGITRKWN